MQIGQTQVLILAGIVLVLALAGGIFFLGRITLPRQDSSGQAAPKPQPQNVATSSPQPSPLSTEASAKVEDPTANWKTYTNNKIGYSFKYPLEMEVLECRSGVIAIVQKARQFDPCQTERSGFMSISIEEGSASRLPDWFYRDYNVSSEDINIDGKPTVRFIGSRSSDTPAPIPMTINIIQVDLKGKILFMDSVDNQILSTFRFK